MSIVSVALNEESRIRIADDADLLSARRQGREVAISLGMRPIVVTAVVTVISELGRNILMYAGRGEILLRRVYDQRRAGVVVTAVDRGPGIPDVERALIDGYSTSGSLGLGLPGTRRLVDQFRIESNVGAGTTVTVTKWNDGARTI